MRPVSLRTSALLLTLIMVLMPMTPFADQNFESSDSKPETNEPLNEQIVMSAGNTGNADSIAFGLQSGCAIGASGNIKCWGNGGDGQLGLGNTQNIGDSIDETGTDLPFVNLGTNASVDKIVMGDKHSCALFTNGSVKCWGESSVLGLGYSTSDGGFGDGYLETGDTLPFLQFPTGRHATMIEAGKSHTCAVMDNDDLICWGDNSKGQLGLGDTAHRGDVAGEIGDNFEVTSVPTGRTIDSMALGWDHTCVVWDNASVSCWGGNDHGQLGLDSTTDIGDGAGEMGDNLDFLDLPGTASAITAGDGFTCAIVDDSGTDRAFCWGLNDYGQLGIESTTNVGDGTGGSMSSISNADLTHAVQAIDAGEDHVCAIVKISTYRPVQCWGNGADGRLGYGSQDSRGTGPGSTSGMGSNLGYVRLTSSGNHYTYSMTDIEAGAGTTCVKSNGYNDVFCWGDNGIGQLGYGDTEDRGDGQTDLPFITELALQLDEEVMDNACDILAIPESRDELDKRLDSDSSDTGDLISMFEIPTTGCPAIAYYDSGSSNLKFAAYDNGMWSVETLGSDSGITDIDLVLDSNGIPHIMHLSSTNAYPDYTTKADGMWAESTLQVVTESLSLSIDDSDSITFARYDDSGSMNSIYQLVSYSCSADCDTWSNWNQDSTVNQDTAHFETVDGHQVYIDGNQNGLYYRIDSAGSSYLVSREVSQSDTYMVTSIDTAPDGTVGIAHTNDTTYKTYFSHCSSTCSSSSSWTTELVSSDTSSQVVLQYAADGTPWILLKHNTSGETLFHRENGQWEEYTFSNWPGDSDSFGMIINSAGYIYTSLHLVNPGELWAVSSPTVAGTGLSMDADGDGWIGMRELACGTDRMDPSSTPVDFDMDGHCDSIDTHVDLPATGDSDVLAQGMDFACAIVNEGDIECWGDNTYGKLGGSAPGVSWPAGFTAISIDAGESHACALSAELQIMCWGRNNYGQIGIGTTSASEPPTILNTDTYVQSTYPAWFSSLEVAYHDLAVGANHACALLKPIQFYEDELVVCWGNGADSQTGQYAVTDSTAGYEDDFETGSPSSIWTLEGTGGQFGSQWTVDTTDASSGSNSFKSNTHQSNSDVGFLITKQFQSGYVSFDFKTDTCPVLNNCNDRFEFSIDNTVMNSTKGQNGWTTYNTTVSQGIHTLRWTFIKDGSSTNDANGDYVAVDNIDIRTGFRIESGGVLDEPQRMDINTNGLVTSIVAGERHTCITNHLEELLCMGYNGGSNHMVLGNSSTTADNSSELVKVDVDFGTSKVKAVSAGYDTSCAILDNSTQAYCWGKRADWSDSTGTTQSGTDLLGSSTNAQISGTWVDLGTAGDRIHSISMGEVHACAVVENTIECWGVEESGSFGMSSSSVDSYSTPQTISVPSGLTAKQVVIEHSTDSTCGVFETSSGAHTVICWGDETAVGYTSSNPVTTLSNAPVEDSNGDDLEMYEISSSPDDIVDLQMGNAHACALSRQGFVKCWGYNGDGELGYGNHINRISPWNGGMAHGEKHPMLYFGQNRTVTQMDIGYDNACALLDDGSISCWGEYRESMFTNSIGTSGDQYTPLSLTQFGTDNVKVVIGYATVCSLKESGEVYCTGERAGMGYQYNGDQTTPRKITGAHPTEGKVVDIVAMKDYDSDSGSCAIFESGATKCWGQNTNFHQLRSDWTTPFNFYDMRGILTEDLEVGRHYACMLVSTTTELNDGESLSPEPGEIVCWGEGSYGKTGLGVTNTYALTSSAVAPLDFNGVSMIDVEIGPASQHTCSISDDRELYCWGINGYGQLGQGNTDNIGDSAGEMSGLNPVDIVGKSKIVALGSDTTCTVTTSNHVYCWGDGGLVNWGSTSANVGDASGEMGTNLRPVPMIMTPYDNDNDGIINLWDSDDDNDGYLDVDDDFDFDECAHLDTDGDGKPDSIVSNCSTDLTEDLDDDNDQWTDIEEQSCLTNSKLSTSKPFDTDNDGTCDYIDTDDDNDGWSDAEEQACERKEWNSRQIFSSNYGYDNAYPSGIVWLPNNKEMQFQTVGIGISNEYIRMGGHTTANIESSSNTYTLHQNYGSSGQQGFDHAKYGAGAYLVNDEKLLYMEYSSSSSYDYPASNEIYTFNSSQQNQHHEIAISDEGSIFLTTNAGIVNIDAGVTSYIDYPTGVSTSQGFSKFKQIAVDSNGDLHLISYHLQAARIYTWIYDVSSESWNSGLDSFPGSLSDVGPGRSSFTVDSSNQPHVAFMKGTSATDTTSYVTYNYYDNTAQNWVTRFSDYTPSGYNGVSLELDSNDNIHIAWVDNGNKSLYHTQLSSTSNTQSTTLIKQNTYGSYWNTEHVNLEIEISKGDDPWIIWSPYTSVYSHNQIFHYGSAIDESKDSAKYPADHDSDGTCDMLESATLDYGIENMIFEMEMDLSYMPEYPAMIPTSVSINPALPSGLTLNTTTGKISGKPTTMDLSGTNYVITTDSGVETWSTNLTIKSTMENPMYIGYQTMHGHYDDYTTFSKTAFTNDGEIVTLEGYTGSNSITIDGVAAGGNHDSNDIVLSMRNPMGDYLWAKSIRGYDFSIGDVDVDNNGNIYALFSAQARSSDPVEFNFEGISIDNNGMHTLFLAKWDYYGNLQWVVDTESSGTSQYADIEGNGGSDHLSSPMDLDKATGDVAIIAMGQASNDDLEFGGVSIGPFGTCLTNHHQPWVAKVNTNGQVQWTAVGKSNPTSCSNVYDQHVVLHHDGSVTTAGKASGNGGYNFGQHSASTSSSDYGSWIAHADSSGNWAWAENASSKDYVGSTTSRQHWLTMDKFSDDTLFFAFVDKEDTCTELSFAGTKSTLYHSTTSYCMHAVTMNHTNSDVIALETLIGYSHGYTDFISEKVYSAVDSNDIVHVFSDKDNGIDMRTTGFDQGLNTAYDVTSSSWSASSYKVSDFGLDHSESIYFTGEQYTYYMSKSAYLLEKCQPGDSCTSPNWEAGQNRLDTGHRLYRFWGDYDHEINYNSPSEGTSHNSRIMGEHSSSIATYQLNNSSGVTNSAALPCGLSFNTGSGQITGTPTNGCTDTANETYTITVTQGSSYAWARNQSFEVTFGIGPAVPVVSYNSADTTQTYTRGVAITPIAPTGITNSGNLHHFTTYPPLPAGLSVNSTGHIIGTPTANQSTAIFKVKSCNSWNVCSAGVPFTITINEPAPVISYADSEYEFFKDVPITPIVPTSTGGVPSSWEISPALPTGLSLRGDGAIVGIPFVDSTATDYTIWANNTGGSGTAVLEITINGTGIFINYPYNTAELAQYSPMMALYPSTSGAAIVSWSIEPTLPSGIFFGTNNGTIWGTPSTLTQSAVYTINATGVEDYGTATVTISVLTDTDLDSIPDINDDDIDGDGWSNVDETNCLTDEMDENDYPSDIDQDRICDLLDTSDDRAIIVIYLDNSLELAINSTMNPLVPITAGGDITSWAISPALPLGLEFNGTMPGRSTSDTGAISGTPTELSDSTIYTIWANNSNSGQSGSFQITLSVLEDTDGDGIPDIYDDDMDGDGWSNEMENLCGEDPEDASSTPVDTDGDGLCNYIDSDDDNDSFIDTEEIMCNSDSEDQFSVPIDDDNDGICDALQSDRDLDGWADGPEESCGSDPDDASSVPVDSDGDMICDSQDDDRDGDAVGNNVDDFPDDRSASKDTDGDGKPDSLSGTSTSDPPLVEDFDDDNDNWSDYKESECGTDPLDETSFPVDSDGDGTCDALEDDTDGDGFSDAEDAFPMDGNEWLDTDEDGIGNNADEDDDGDNWSDADEDRCGSDPLDSQSVPANIEEDGTCVTTKSDPKKDDDSSSSTMWWICVCLPLLLLLLLIPLIYWSRERGDSLMVIVGMRNGPEPENTTSRPNFVSGSGTKNDPFVLKPAHVENFGDSVISKESITISKLDPDTLVTITDMAASTNRGRFNMDSILVEGSSDEKGSGSIVFQLSFDDNVTEDDVSGVYTGQIRVGSASVYLMWEVTVGDPEADELAAADLRASQLKAEEEAELKAIEEAEARDKAEKEAAEKKAKEEADAKSKAEKEATEKKLKEAEEKAAAAEAKAAAAEQKAAAEKKAKEEAEDAARLAAEKAAQERLEQMEKEMEERRAKLAEMDEATRKKEEELLRISEKAKSIDFTTLGVAARSVASKPVEKGATEVSIGDTSDFDEAGSAWVQDDEGGMNISWTGKTATALTGVKGLKRGFAAAATVTASDDLQRIKGVGPFIEDKLNALGIYTFEQVGNMNSEIEEQVNIAIEFFPGRIKRDKWANQARKFAKEK